MKWFRLYSAVVHDPKVQRLHPAHFKHWINILCLTSGNDERGIVPDAKDVSYSLRVKPCEADAILLKLEDVGLLDRTEDGRLTPHNWTERQRCTDDVATRVRRHREKKAIETEPVAQDVTLLKRTVDTDTDTDTEVDKKEPKDLPASDDADDLSDDWISKKKRKLEGKRLDSFKLFWDAFDFKKGRAAAIDSWLDIPELRNSLVLKIVAAAKLEANGRLELIRQGQTPKWPQGWLTDRRWEDEAVTLVAQPLENPFDALRRQRNESAVT